MTSSPDHRAWRLALSAMQSEGRPLTVKEIAVRIGKAPSTVAQYLDAMRSADVVTRTPRRSAGGGWWWTISGTPVPENFAVTLRCSSAHNYSASRYDHRALAQALGMDRMPPVPESAYRIEGLL